MRRTAIILVAGLALVGCGGGSSDPAFEPAPETVGTLSDEVAAEPVVREVNAVRKAMESTRADEAVSGIYDLINRAVEEDVQSGTALVREALPSLAATLLADADQVREHVSALELETEGGKAFRDFGLEVIDEQVRLVQRFDADVARAEWTWGAVVRFGEDTNELVQLLDSRLEELRRELPADQRDALDKAAQQLFGN